MQSFESKPLSSGTFYKQELVTYPMWNIFGDRNHSGSELSPEEQLSSCSKSIGYTEVQFHKTEFLSHLQCCNKQIDSKKLERV